MNKSTAIVFAIPILSMSSPSVNIREIRKIETTEEGAAGEHVNGRTYVISSAKPCMRYFPEAEILKISQLLALVKRKVVAMRLFPGHSYQILNYRPSSEKKGKLQLSVRLFFVKRLDLIISNHSSLP